VSITDSQALPTLARERLRVLTGDPRAEFRPGQLEAIRDVVIDRARVLCVQRTGWGKSAVYFLATALLREAGAGPTLIVSPLLALMRNQIAAAERLGLRAHTINSTNRDEWDLVRDRLAANTVDLLLISPERLNNPLFREEMLPLFAASVGLLVIDEAHCISDWGHDFRPDYRRVKDMLDRLAPGVAVLGTTATANDRVVADVVVQLQADDAGEPLRTYRGPLSRPSLRLEVLDLPQPAQRLAWLASTLPGLSGSGIVYTLTKRDAEQVASFLCAQGISAVAYSGEHETEHRIEIEDRLSRNEIKAVIATSALGMCYDKPDLSFVVHYQAPGSVVSYYQQIGRAGRALDHADIVLLRGGEDRRIQDFFIEQAFPDRERVMAVLADLEAAGDTGRTTRELMTVVNLGMGRIEAMLKILDVEGAVTRAGSRWKLVADADWSYDRERYEQVTALRRAEQRAMAAFGSDGRCLMRALQEELDDPSPADCGCCSVCAGPRFARSLDPGWALARFGDGGWWPAIERGLSSGEFEQDVVDALCDLLSRAGADWLTTVPSAALGDRLERLADRLPVPHHRLLARVEARPPQREMANAAQQVANVRGAFRVLEPPPRGVGVLLDDRRHSGWTLAMVGGQLRRAGAERIVPLALASL
jgi:ATP-dependent DNA helicase RecQ